MLIDEIRQSLHDNRDLLARSLLAFSGGKESVLLWHLVRDVCDVPLIYAHCPGVEWPEHEAFVRECGAEMWDTGHDWDWFLENPWVIFHEDAKTAERWARIHHRRLRAIAQERGMILLWGNRTADGNTVPAIQYESTCSLWMPLRDVRGDLSEWKHSPIYEIPSCGGTGYMLGRIRNTSREDRMAAVRSRISSQRFQQLCEVLSC